MNHFDKSLLNCAGRSKRRQAPGRLAVRPGDIIVRVLRVRAVSVPNYLEMAMVAERAARVAHIGNQLALGDIFPFRNHQRIAVGIQSFQAVAVVDAHIVAVRPVIACAAAREGDNAVIGRIDGCALRRGNIQPAVVVRAPARNAYIIGTASTSVSSLTMVRPCSWPS